MFTTYHHVSCDLFSRCLGKLILVKLKQMRSLILMTVVYFLDRDRFGFLVFVSPPLLLSSILPVVFSYLLGKPTDWKKQTEKPLWLDKDTLKCAKTSKRQCYAVFGMCPLKGRCVKKHFLWLIIILWTCNKNCFFSSTFRTPPTRVPAYVSLSVPSK